MSDPITIRTINVRHCRMRAERRGTYSNGSKDPEWNVWLFVSIGDGEHTGYGECVPTSLFYEPGHIGRSDIDEWQTLLDLCETLVGKDARELGRLVPKDDASDDANSIHDTVDFALHDLVGRRLGVPVSVLLGGKARPFVWAVPVIHLDTPDAMSDLTADLHRKWGFMYYKLKPHGVLDPDVETLTKMREKMGPEVRYYMDANYSIKIEDLDEVVAYMNKLHELGLEVYEDPLDVDFATLRYINDRTPVRIMIDERARTSEAVLRILQEQCAGQINIHANWSGGFQPGIRKAQLAAIGGMPTMVGSTRYLGPGAAAYQTMASALPLEAPCEQVYREVFGGKSAISDPYEIQEGKIFIRDAPGLGVTPDLEAIRQITIREETFESV